MELKWDWNGIGITCIGLFISNKKFESPKKDKSVPCCCTHQLQMTQNIFYSKNRQWQPVNRFNNNHNSQDLSMRRLVHTFYKLFYQYLFSISINLVIGHNYHYYIHFSSTLKYLGKYFHNL